MAKARLDQLARIISTVTEPPFMVALAILGLGFYYHQNSPYAWVWAIWGMLLILGPASIYVIFAYRYGKLKHLTLVERRERFFPLFLALIGAVGGAVILNEKDASTPLLLLSYILITELILILIINIFWKISVHMMTLGAIVTVMALLGNGYLGFLYLVLLPVGWSRIYRQRHTLAQVIVGAIVGIIITLAIFWSFNYRI